MPNFWQLKSVHFKKTVARILFLSKLWNFLFWFVLKIPQYWKKQDSSSWLLEMKGLYKETVRTSLQSKPYQPTSTLDFYSRHVFCFINTCAMERYCMGDALIFHTFTNWKYFRLFIWTHFLVLKTNLLLHTQIIIKPSY